MGLNTDSVLVLLDLDTNILDLWCPPGVDLRAFIIHLYMLPLGQIIKDNTISYHSYADDTQIYIALSPNDIGPLESLC